MKLSFHLLACAAIVAAGMMTVNASDRWELTRHRTLSPNVKSGLTVKQHQKQAAARPWIMQSHKREQSQFATKLSPKMFSKPQSSLSRKLAPAKVSSDIPTIYGNLTFAYNWFWEEEAPGIYSFPADMSEVQTPVFLDPKFSTDSGVVFDLTYHGHRYDYDDDADYWVVYDVQTGNLLRQQEVDYSYSATDLAYSPANGLMYGCFLNEDGDDYEFCSVDPETLERDVINQTSFSGYERLVAIATHPDGRMFGVTLSGILEEIDPDTGSVTQLADVGFPVSNYVQTATFDPASGLLFWAANTIEGECLLLIDVDSLSLGYIGAFEMMEQWAGLYILADSIDPEAPASVSDVEYLFPEGNLQGAVAFVIPTLTYGGSPLSGEVSYVVRVNDETMAEGSAKPGEKVSCDVAAEYGLQKFDIIVSNEAGEGKMIRNRVWIGCDIPNSVSDLSLAIAGQEALLTWSAPTEGIHGGYVNPEEVTYTVIRLPENVTAAENLEATTFTETLPDNTLTAYRYVVIPHFNGESGEGVTSEKVWNGHAFEVPYSNDFSDEDSRGLVTILDFDEYEQDPNDEWSAMDVWWFLENWGTCELRVIMGENQDDWAILPPLRMTSDRNYRFFGHYDTFLEPAEVMQQIHLYAGSGENVEDYVEVPFELTEDYDGNPCIEALYAPAADADVRFALRANGPVNLYFWSLLDYSVDVKDVYEAPANVTDLSVKAGEKGSLSATVSFIAPAEKCNGEALQSISNIDIDVDGKIVKSIQNPVPGEKVTVELRNLANGIHIFTVIPCNESGAGRKASQRLFIGRDIPAKVDGIKVKDNVDELLVSWDAPSVGNAGGYINPSELSYDVYTYDSYYGELTSLGSTTETSFVDKRDMTGGQRLIQHAIIPSSPEGEGEIAIASGIAVGEAWKLPFRESFTRVSLDNPLWWNDDDMWMFYISPGYSTWGDDMDGTEGLMCYTGNVPGRITSGKIDISGTSNPSIILGYYLFPGAESSFSVGAFDDQQNYHLLRTFDYSGMECEEGWQEIVIGLQDLIGSKYVNLCFDAVCNDYDKAVMIDNIRVRDLLEHNLISYMAAPDFLTAGRMATVNVTVENYSLNDASDYIVRLFADGVEVDIYPGQPLEFAEELTYPLDFVVPATSEASEVKLEVVVDYALDCDQSDNRHSTVLELRKSTLPAPENIKADTRENGDVALEWNAPDIAALGTTVEDFESYKAWSRDGLGDWTTVDRDGEYTYSHAAMHWPNMQQPHAYIVFKPTEAGDLDALLESGYDFRPYSGDQYLASFCPDEWYAYNTESDDWLISPELSGKPQTISVMARSLVMTELMNVYYSTESNAIEDFKPLEEYIYVEAEWTKFEFTLPADAKYFAIRHISSEVWALFIDDIEYKTPANDVVPVGFNLYKDGELLTELPWTSTDYIDGMTNDEHLYQVTAVYDLGESAPATVRVNTTGIGSISSNDVRLADEGNILAVYGCEGMMTEVTSADGKVIYAGVPSDTLRLDALAGIYLVKCGKSVSKIRIK